ncbi:MAG: SDR family NAD(P)-dependent oxidoreductase, partial [Desulfobacterales bacterium]|nr:SDR family NAD(P)-dependent oxidoreductase [Desulfobacterales bacterium]
HGKKEYGSYPFVEFKILNIEDDVISQGYLKYSFDIIVASNVLHATRNIKNTIRNVKSLLKQDGILILNEATKVLDYITLTFGLLEGWWLFEDEDIRIKGSPLLSNVMWEKILKEEGFSNVVTIGEKGKDSHQHVFIAENQKKGTNRELSQREIVDVLTNVLQIDMHDFDIDLPYRDFGVDSILAVQIINKLNEKLNLNLRTTDLYNYSTTRKLIEHIFMDYRYSDSAVIPSNEGIQNIDDVAIIGIACRFPDAENPEEFWDNLSKGKDSIINEGNFFVGRLSDVDKFDSLFFNISPKEAEFMDPQQRLFLQEAWRAIEDAGYAPSTLDGKKCGVFVGFNFNDYNDNVDEVYSLTGNSESILSARISYFLNLKGPSISINSACSSSLVAVHLACESIKSGTSDIALAGGVQVITTNRFHILALSAGMLSVDGKCRTFDLAADGFVPSEGVGVVVLKALSKAKKDQDQIYGIIKGSHINQDGKTNGITAPSASAQTSLECEAYDRYKINPEMITYIEAHGTGTKLGDPIEIHALTDAFRKYTNKTNYCGIGSVKTNIGHTLAAAGIAGLIKILLCIKHKKLVPSLHFENENPHIKFKESPFYVNTKVCDWNKPRIAAISAFGFSGTNAHLIIEEYEGENKSSPEMQLNLIVVSAKNEERLKESIKNLLDFIERHNDISITDVAYTLQVARQALEERIAVVASDFLDLKYKLTKYIKEERDIQDVYTWNTSTKKAESKFLSGLLISGKPGKEFIRLIIEEREIGKLGRLWTLGAEINWDLLYPNHLPRRISIPTYPFSKDRYWSESRNIYGVHHLAQDVDLSLSLDEGGIVFKKILNKSDHIVLHHNVKNDLILPGAAILEMAYSAALSVVKEKIKLDKIVFREPLIISENKKEIQIVIKKENENILLFQIKSKSIKYSEGEFNLKAIEPAFEKISLEETKSRCNIKIEKEEVYNNFKNAGLNYGRYFQGLDFVIGNNNEALGKLTLPKELERDFGNFKIHPSIIDTALQSICGIKSNDKETLIPFVIEGMELLTQIPKSCYSYVKAKSSREFEVNVLDTSGNLCLKFNKVTLKSLPDNLSNFFYTTRWIPYILLDSRFPRNEVIPAKAGIHNPENKNILIFYHNESIEIKDIIKSYYSNDSVFEINLNEEDFNLNKFTHIDIIWFLGGIDSKESQLDDLNHLEITQEYGVFSLFRLIKSLIQNNHTCLQLKIVTNDLYMVFPDDNIKPFSGSLYGLAKVLAKEYIEINVSLIDINLKDLKSFFPFSNTSKEIAVRGGKPYERVIEQIKLSDISNLPFKTNGVYLIVGGAGGIGIEFAKYLSKSFKANIILIGRRLINDEIKENLSKIEELGGRALYFNGDASDFSSMENIVKEVKLKFGEINGAIHSAIVLKDRALSKIDENAFKKVLSPKVSGSVILYKVLKNEPLDFILFFSAGQSFFPNKGQSNYASASTFEDAYGLCLNSILPYPVKVINWGYWGSVGIVATDKYRNRFEEEGIGSIEPKEGIEAVQRVLSCKSPQIIILKVKDEISKLGIKNKQKIYESTIPSILSDVISKFKLHIPNNNEINYLNEGFAEINRFGIYLLLSFFKSKGVFISAKESYGKDELRLKLNIIESYNRLYESLLDILIKADLIQRKGNLISAKIPIESIELKERKQELIGKYKELLSYINLIEICTLSYSEVLSGKKGYAEVMFPGGSKEIVSGIYKGNALTDYYNLLVAGLITKYVELRNKSQLKILEVGAGTGATTNFILDGLKDYGDQITYYYTDISSSFTEHGRKIYGKLYPFVQFMVLDIEKNTEKQGIPINSVDIIIGTNVIHATKQISITLNNLKKLLKKNGLLIVNEVTKLDNFPTQTFGLTDGWWNYEDDAFRIPNSPLLTVETWKNILEFNGIINLHVFDLEEKSKQAIIVGESDGRVICDIEKPHVLMDSRFRRNDFSPAKAGIHSWSKDIEDHIKTVFSRVLKIKKSQFDNETTFEKYGVDSLVTLEINKEFEKDFGKLPVTLLFENPTISDLINYFSSKHKDVLSPKILEHKISNSDIAIIGVSGKFPLSETLNDFWENLKNGKSCIREVPKDRWDISEYSDSIYSKWGGFIDDIDKFDPLFFNISPREAKGMDPQERLFLQTAWSVIEDAGLTRKEFKRFDNKVGVFVGVMNNNYAGPAYWSIANRVSYFFNFKGPSLAVDTACSSSLTAIHLACESLKKGECKIAIAGGVNLILHPIHYQKLCDMNMLARDNKCKTFGIGADGFIDGEGVGAVLLKPLNMAVSDNDLIYGVIKATSINSGGKTSGYTVPNPNAQADLIIEAIDMANINPETISYVEAHGTGTELGDPVEISGLTKAFNKYTDKTEFISIGSVKSNIGHLESASGIAGLTKILLQMKHKKLTPTLNCESLNPHINFKETPFYVQNIFSEWLNQESPRRASLSSFGAGGANAHLIIEEYENKRKTLKKDISQSLIILSAKNEERLKKYVENILGFIKKEKSVNIEDIAYTLQIGREHMDARIAVMANNINELEIKLKDYLSGNLNNDLNETAKLWLKGSDVDFKLLYPNELPKRISLPTYPFMKKRYWKDTKSKEDFKGFFYKPKWIVSNQKYELSLENRKVLIVYPSNNLKIEDEFAKFYYKDHVIKFKIDKEQEIPNIEYLTDILFLGGLKFENDLDKLDETGFALFKLIKGLIKYNLTKLNLKIITNNVFKILSEDRIRPFGASLYGLSKVIPKEYPEIKVSCIDISLDDVLFDCTSVNVKECGIRRGIIYEQVLEPIDLTPAHIPPFKNKGVYFILGGMGGLGFELSCYLAKNFEARLALIGRSSKNSQIQEKIIKIEELGGSPIYIQADAADLTQMEKAVKEAKSNFGAINGAVHSAIVLKDSSLSNMDEETFRMAMSPKVSGSIVLYKVLESEPLDFMMFFSSAQSFFSNHGQSNYAAACTFKDAFANYISGMKSWNVKIINWGYFGEIGVVSNDLYNKNLASQGVISIKPFEYIEAVSRILNSSERQVVAFKGEQSLLEKLGITTKADKKTLIHLKEAFLNLNKFGRQLLTDTMPQIDNANKIIPSYKRLYDALLNIPVIESSERISKDDLIKNFPEIKPHINLLDICFANYPEILTGKMSASDIIFKDSSLELIEGIYKGYESADYYNNVVSDAVFSYISKKDKVKILEIGAGTGGTTCRVLENISKYSKKISYVYSDISHVFLQHGKKNYGHYQFVDFKILNIENERHEPDKSEQFDLIIASNVLHATKNIKNTIKNVKSLLKNYGQLILNETICPIDFTTMTFGLLDGWWNFEDENLRIKDSPLLSFNTWKQVLLEEGFDKVQRIDEISDDRDIFHQMTIVAEIKPSVYDKVIESICDVLHVGKEEIDANTAYTGIGVDSILAVKIINNINDRLKVNLRTTDLYSYPTPQKLNDYIISQYRNEGDDTILNILEKLSEGGIDIKEAVNLIDGKQKELT